MKKFKKNIINRFLPKKFKGLTKKYMLEMIFDDELQKHWVPEEGDIIVGETGNVFVISVVDDLHEKIGGKRYYFGGGSCARSGSGVMDSTFYYTANESGVYIHPINGPIENLNHSSIRDFKFVPYPHELRDRCPKLNFK